MTHTSHHDAPRHACANAVSGLTTRQNRTRRTLSCTLSAAKVQPTTTLLSSLHPAKSWLRTALQSIHATNCASDVLAATNRGPAWARRRTWSANAAESRKTKDVHPWTHFRSSRLCYCIWSHVTLDPGLRLAHGSRPYTVMDM